MKNPLLQPNHDIHSVRGGTHKSSPKDSFIPWREVGEDPTQWGDVEFEYVVFGFRVFRTKEKS